MNKDTLRIIVQMIFAIESNFRNSSKVNVDFLFFSKMIFCENQIEFLMDRKLKDCISFHNLINEL